MKKIFSILAATMMAVTVMAQEEEASKPVSFAYEAGAEIVSAYIWRGQYNGSLSFQPTASVGFDALDEAIQFRAGVWASLGASDWMFKKNMNDGRGYTKFMPELDVILSFSAYGASVGMNHYYYCDGTSFFNWKSVDDIYNFGSTSTTEVWVGYNFEHFFGQNAYINWYTTVAGNDLVYGEDEFGDETYRRAWSSYFEIGYDHTFESIDLTIGAVVGMTPWKSLYTDYEGGFAVNNIALRIGKTWNVNDVCDIELFGLGSINTYGINKDNCFVSEAGDYKLGGVQKLNGTIGLGFWF